MANSASAPREHGTPQDEAAAQAPARPLSPARPEDGSASTQLVTEQGRTVITDTVVSKIAGTATRQVDGVHGLGGGTARAVEALRGRIPGARINHAQGVAVEVGERQTAIDIGIVAEYGVAIYDLGSAIRSNVIDAVERMTGLEVVEVNVTVYDVHLPTDEDPVEAETSSRVQ